MNAATKGQARRPSRKIYLVDRHMQWSITWRLLLALGGIASLYVAAIFILPGKGSIENLTAEETRSLFIQGNLIYFLLASGILALVALLLTHRVAGPAYVIEQALHGMREGDFSRRLTLRDHDYLKSLAACVMRLSAHMQQQDEARRQTLADLRRCLQEKDIPAAQELLGRLQGMEPLPQREQAVASVAAPNC